MSETSPLQRFLAELKRRRVFRVAAAYGAVGFVILQVAELIADGLLLPATVRTTITIVVLLGFPVALVLAWVLERGPGGDLQRTADAAPSEIERIVSEPWTRRWPAGLLALVGTVLLLTGGWFGFDRIRGDSEGDRAVETTTRGGAPGKETGVAPGAIGGTGVVILPFAVQGSPDVAYLGEGLVSLLGTKLDGAGDLQTVDSRAVMHAVERQGLEPGDAVSGSRAAAEFGSRYYIVGNIVEAGGRMQLAAALYDAEGGGAPIGEASVEGTEDEMFEMVDGLAAELLSGLSGGAAARVRRIAAVTTASLPALRAFFEGEEQFRRGQFASAVASFQRAVEEDSTFALAYYRLSIVAEWALLGEVSDASALEAIRWADRLAPRDRRMLDAYLTRRRGDNLAAARAYRSILGSYPDEMEAWLDLSEVLFHANPLYGLSFTDSRATLDRVLEFDPNHATALIHLARLAAFQGDLPRLDSLAERFIALDPDPGRTVEIEALRASRIGDTVAWADVVQRLSSTNDVGLVLAGWSIGTYARNLDAAIEVASALTAPDRSLEARQQGLIWLAYFELARGKWEAAKEELEELARFAPGTALEYEAMLATMPFAPVSDTQLADILNRLERLDPESIPPSSNPSVAFSSHDGLHPFIRAYLLGLLEARLGREDDALRYADAAGAIQLESTSGSLADDLSHSVRAAVHYQAGRLEQALAELEAPHYDAWYGQTMVSPLFARVAERFLRAEILFDLERYDEAEDWYTTIGEICPSGLPYRTVALLRLASIAEERGDAAIAADYQSQFDALWAEADPDLLARVSE